MNALQTSISTPLAAAIARTLVHSLWEGTAIAAVLAVTLFLIRSPRARYGAACFAILLLLCSFAVTLNRELPDSPVRLPRTAFTHVAVAPPATTAPSSTVTPHDSDDPTWLVPLWLAGVLLFHLKGLASWLSARRLRRTGVCAVPELWLHRLTHLQTKLQMNRSVALLESCLAEVPVVIGYIRPVILMPIGLLAGLPAGQVEAILLHELAHIRRYDYLVNLAQVFVEGILFYHPAVWWISGVMRAERENCCDDAVISITGGAHEFATALTALENRRANPATALAATDGSLVKRIHRLLGRPERRYATAMPAVTAAILIATAITAVAALPFDSDVRQFFPNVRQSSEISTLALLAQTLPPAAAQPASGARRILPSQPQSSAVDPVLLAQARPAPQPAPTSQPTQSMQPDQVLYERAIANIERGQYLAARLTLNTLINTYATSSYLPKAKLAIADSWSRQGGAEGKAQAEVEYRDLLIFYPNTPQADLAARQLEFNANMLVWLNEEVVYIISQEERKAFLSLATLEEQRQFAIQFWDRRDPTPGTPENEYKTEHYRRLAYANEHFTPTYPGWRTDRGHIYIQFGPPDELEKHPATASAPAEEDWRYRWIDGVGQNVVVRFIDKAANGTYSLATDLSSVR